VTNGIPTKYYLTTTNTHAHTMICIQSTGESGYSKRSTMYDVHETFKNMKHNFMTFHSQI